MSDPAPSIIIIVRNGNIQSIETTDPIFEGFQIGILDYDALTENETASIILQDDGRSYLGKLTTYTVNKARIEII